MELLRSLDEDGQTIVMVTHSPENARYAHKTVHVTDGMLKTAVAA